MGLTLYSIFSSWISVNFTFEGLISEPFVWQTNNSLTAESNKVIEILLNQTLLDLVETPTKIEIELTQANLIVYRCEGAIIQTSMLKDNSQGLAYKAIFAKAANDGMIEFFPSKIEGKYKAFIKIKDVKVSLTDMMQLIMLKELCSIEINRLG